MSETPKGAWDKFREDVALNGVVILLVGISFVATWRGLADFVSVQDETSSAATGWIFQGLVFAVVFALTLAMYVSLRELMRWRNWKRVIPGVLALVLYGLLALWSVGFGYGFWWSLVAGQATSERELEQAVGSIETSIAGIEARIGTAETLMRDAAQLSSVKANQEANVGASCGVASGIGEGRLYRARMETNAQIATLAESVSTQWAPEVGGKLDELRTSATADLVNTVQGEAADAAGDFEAKWNKAVTAARDISANAQSRGAAYAAQLRGKADQLDDAPVAGEVAYCYDPDLARALRLAADALDFEEEIEIAAWSYSGGKAGVARAIESLWSPLLKPFGVEMRGAGFDGRSLVALVAAIGVDLALFVFTIFQSVAAAERNRAVRVIEDIRETKAELAATKADLQSANEKRTSIENEMKRASAQKADSDEKIRTLEEDISQLKSQISRLTAERDDWAEKAKFDFDTADRALRSVEATLRGDSQTGPEDALDSLKVGIKRLRELIDKAR